MDNSDHSTTETTPPRPGWILIANSLLVIAICIFVTSLGLSAFASFWDPGALASGSILLLLSVVMGMLQYRATFRRNPDAAARAGFFFYLGSGFLLLAGIVTLSERLSKGTTAGELLSIVGPLVLLGSYTFFCAWLNRHWAYTLDAAAENQDVEPPDPHAPFQISPREILALATVVAIIVGLTAHRIRHTPPQFAEGVSAAEAPAGLPDAATDVTFYQGIWGTIAFEFTIDEQGFLAWAKTPPGLSPADIADTPLERLDGTKPIQMPRCYQMSPEFNGPDTAKITHGYYYDCRKKTRRVQFAYDLDTHRAYYYTSIPQQQ